MVNQRDKEIQEKDLQDLFNQPGWEWFEKELKYMAKVAMDCLKTRGVTDRDYFAGKCNALDDIFRYVERTKEKQ